MKKTSSYIKTALLLITFGLTNCKVTEENVAGYYQTSAGDMLVLKSDHSCKIDVGLKIDTVLHLFRSTITTNGHWQLNKKIISLTVDNPEYKSWELTLKVKGNMLTCVQSHCPSYKKTARPEDPIYSLRIGTPPNKTLQDTSFKRGDVIRIPEIRFSLDGDGSENYDSLKIVADFLKAHPKLVVEIGSHTDARGYAESNLDLSIKRAESVRDYLLSKFSLNPEQITCKGYGETKPLIPDTEISKATSRQEKEMLHQTNRRTTMTVIKVK